MISAEPISPSCDPLQADLPADKAKVKRELPPDAAQLFGDRDRLQLITLSWVMTCIDETKDQSWELTSQVIKALGWIVQKAVVYDRAAPRISSGRRRIRS